MIKEQMKEILEGINLKENLKLLKEDIKTSGSAKQEAQRHLDAFVGLLASEDVKVRMNAASILGMLGNDETVAILLNAYRKETTRYARISYLNAIAGLPYESEKEQLAVLLRELDGIALTEENRKHILEEKKQLISMVGEKCGKHRFTGYDKETELILITNRDHKKSTVLALKGIPYKEFNAGVMVKTDRLREVFSCRLYDTCYFAIPGCRELPEDATEAGRKLAASGLYEYIASRHEGGEVYGFRITLKRKENDDRGKFAKRLASTIEEETGWKLLCNQDDYEVEIRLIERTSGGFSVMLSFGTLKDMRFAYRTEVVASSIRPYNAALTVNLAAKYLSEDAVVLDPFCGVGTMLVERAFAGKVKAMYGIDIFGEAIAKAKSNIAHFQRGPKVYLVNRDFFDFTLDHKVDEIVTDMPFAMGRTTKQDIDSIYRRFFENVTKFLTLDGKIIMYTHDAAFVKKYMRSAELKLIEEFTVSAKEGTAVCVLGR